MAARRHKPEENSEQVTPGRPLRPCQKLPLVSLLSLFVLS